MSGEKSMFRVGDKATNILVGFEVEVQFGPVVSQLGKTAYLVKDQGQSYLLWEEDMKPCPRFEAGQVVRTRSDNFLYRIVAGPFRREGNPMYVLVDPDGNHKVCYEDHMTSVVE